MDYASLISVLLIYSVLREVVFWVTTHRLLNKLMSRSFHEYQMGNNVGKIEDQVTPLNPFADVSEMVSEARARV